MVTIVQKNDGVLREIAKPIPLSEINTPKIKKIIRDMSKVLATQRDGVAIAAPQISESLRIFTVSKRYFAWKDGIKDDDEKNIAKYSDMVFINPEMIKLSKKHTMEPEGCLSIRWLYGRVSRATKAKIRAYDTTGHRFEIGASGLLAQIFQHEYDHLEGILFIDKATELKDTPPKK